MRMESDKHASSAKRLIVVGASAGGIEALIRLVPNLPADLRALMFDSRQPRGRLARAA
jgi:chemotaxis response regulator CheB